jgi:hypothetical protein
MAAKKLSPQKIEILSRLDMEQLVECLRQFDEQYPAVRVRKEFLGIAVAIEPTGLLLRINVTQLGEVKFTEEAGLPMEFEANFEAINAKAILKVMIKSTPILTSAAPKSAAGKKTAPVFPTSR